MGLIIWVLSHLFLNFMPVVEGPLIFFFESWPDPVLKNDTATIGQLADNALPKGTLKSLT